MHGAGHVLLEDPGVLAVCTVAPRATVGDRANVPSPSVVLQPCGDTPFGACAFGLPAYASPGLQNATHVTLIAPLASMADAAM